MGLDATKPVFGVFDKAKIKPVTPATETSKKIEFSLIASLDIELSKKQITKALISLRGCAGWSASCCSQTPEDRFSRVEAHLCQTVLKIVLSKYFQPKSANILLPISFLTYFLDAQRNRLLSIHNICFG